MRRHPQAGVVLARCSKKSEGRDGTVSAEHSGLLNLRSGVLLIALSLSCLVWVQPAHSDVNWGALGPPAVGACFCAQVDNLYTAPDNPLFQAARRHVINDGWLTNTYGVNVFDTCPEQGWQNIDITCSFSGGQTNTGGFQGDSGLPYSPSARCSSWVNQGPISEGPHTLTVTCTNRLDGSGDSHVWNFIMDTTPPSASISAPAANAILPCSTTTIRVDATDQNGISQISLYSPAYRVAISSDSGSGSTQLTPTELGCLGRSATYFPEVEVFDWALNRTLAISTFVIDGTPPQVSIEVSTSYQISAHASDDIQLAGLKVQVRENSGNTYWNGTNFSGVDPTDIVIPTSQSTSTTGSLPSLPFSYAKSYTVIARAVDEVGNTSFAFSTFTYGPTVPIQLINASLETPVTPTVTFQPNPFTVSYGQTQQICASVSPSEMASTINVLFSSDQKVFQVVRSNSSLPGCDGITVDVKSLTNRCFSPDNIKALLDDGTPIGSAVGNVLLPTRANSYLLHDDDHYHYIPKECWSYGLGINCLEDAYRIVIQSDVPTPPFDLDQVFGWEELKTRQRLDRRFEMCSTKKAISPQPWQFDRRPFTGDPKTGGSVEPIFHLFAGNDMLGIYGDNPRPCGTLYKQQIMVGACDLTKVKLTNLKISSQAHLYQFQTSRDDCISGRSDCSPR